MGATPQYVPNPANAASSTEGKEALSSAVRRGHSRGGFRVWGHCLVGFRVAYRFWPCRV